MTWLLLLQAYFTVWYCAIVRLWYYLVWHVYIGPIFSFITLILLQRKYDFDKFYEFYFVLLSTTLRNITHIKWCFNTGGKASQSFFIICKILIILRGFFFADAICVFHISNKLMMEKDDGTTKLLNQRLQLVICL